MFILLLIQHVKNLWNGEEGITSIEYALMASLIAMVIIVSVISLGDNLLLMYQRVAQEVTNAIS